MELHSGEVQMLTPSPLHTPPPRIILLTVSAAHPALPCLTSCTFSFSFFLLRLPLQLQTRTTSEEDPERDVAGEPPHHATFGAWTHVPWHDSSHRYGSVSAAGICSHGPL